jgi:hypothetical protein
MNVVRIRVRERLRVIVLCMNMVRVRVRVIVLCRNMVRARVFCKIIVKVRVRFRVIVLCINMLTVPSTTIITPAISCTVISNIMI